MWSVLSWIFPCSVHYCCFLNGFFWRTKAFNVDKNQMYILTFFMHGSSLLCSIQNNFSCPLLLLPSCFSCVWLCATPWIVVHQVPLSMGFPGKNTGVGYHFLLQFLLPGHNNFLLYFLWEDFLGLNIIWSWIDVPFFFPPFCTDIQLSKHCLLKRYSFYPIKLPWHFCHNLIDHCVWVYLCILYSV